MRKPDEFRNRYVKPRAGRTLIVGSKVFPGREDARLRFDDAFGVDMQDGDGVDMVHDMEEPLPHWVGVFDHVECTSVLEHAQRPWLVAETIEDCMAPRATIYLSVPVIWRFHGYPDDNWRFLRGAIEVIFPNIAWKASLYQGESGQMRRDHRLPKLANGHYGKVELHAFGRRL